jgi:hypothetical protein
MDLIICTECGQEMPRYENVNGVEMDWTINPNPKCAICRGVPGAVPYHRQRDVLGGFPWKRDVNGKKVQK